MNFITSMLSGKGPISSMRVVTISTAFTILAVYVAHNVLAMVKGLGYIDFPANSVYALLVVIGGKSVQNIFGEKNGTTVAPTVPAIPNDQPVVAPDMQ